MSTRPSRPALALAALALAASACQRARQMEGEPVSAEARCVRCHGGEETSGGAPPRSVLGATATSARAVGAHTAHVRGDSRLAPALGCDACHPVPSPDDPMAHLDGQVRVSFGVLARAGGVEAAWDPAQATCTVYCHGGSMPAAGGDARVPVWTTVDGSQDDCGSCHGAPPPPRHPPRADCDACHPGALTPATAGSLAPAHLNGTVELGALVCSSCHGDADRPGSHLEKGAPPASVTGESATSDRGVGAHQAHLAGGTLSGPVPCETCHAVPGDLGHVDGEVQLRFSAVAVAGGSTPAFDRAGGTCSGTWCHGAQLAGGTLKLPEWTRVDGSQDACGTCHGNPPAVAPHTPLSTGCGACHPGTIDDDGGIDLAGGMHVNGTVEVERAHPAGWAAPATHGLAANGALASCRPCHGADLAGGPTGISCAGCHGEGWQQDCAFCHGEPNRAAHRPAPPQGTQDEVATSARAVGAHQRHLEGGALTRPVACGECHAVPADLAHVDGNVQLAWGPTATAHGASPAFTPAGTCTSTWCHGAGLGGGTLKTPLWTQVDGTQAACTTCHGVPPPLPHPQNPACASCHPGFGPATHVNGTVESNGRGCATCHGDAARAGTELQKASPPAGSGGETSPAARAVGAHGAHVYGSRWSNGFACAECHVVPTAQLHADGAAGTRFGALANASGTATVWNGTTCAASYCHGAALLPGGDHRTPSWTGGAAEAECGACHGSPPALPHPAATACGNCHPGYGPATVDRALHVNGVVDTAGGGCAGCHGDPDRPGTDVQRGAPPRGVNGETSPATRAVGAHEAHVFGRRWSNGFACSECHATPAGGLHADGAVQLRFGPIANNEGMTTAWNGTSCGTSYCHDPPELYASNPVPVWTGGAGEAECGACHISPTALVTNPGWHRVHSIYPCTVCHDGYGMNTVNRETHVNGLVEATQCDDCHASDTP